MWVPPALNVATVEQEPALEPLAQEQEQTPPTRQWLGPDPGDPIELDKPVPPSGNMSLCGHQFWLGPARAGQVVRFWIDCDWVHLSIGGQRIKSLRSRFTVTDLAILAAQGGMPAGPAPLSSKGGPGSRAGRTIVEVERTVGRNGIVSLGQRAVLAADILAGRRVGIYIEEGAPLLFFDPETRELLRTRPNPLEPGEAARLQRCRPVGPIPRPSTEPIRVQRRASNSGIIQVVGQKIALGRQYIGHTVTVLVSETTLAIDLGENESMIIRRTNDQPVRSIKGQRPRTATTSVS
jgi:hypothetical protein